MSFYAARIRPGYTLEVGFEIGNGVELDILLEELHEHFRAEVDFEPLYGPMWIMCGVVVYGRHVRDWCLARLADSDGDLTIQGA